MVTLTATDTAPSTNAPTPPAVGVVADSVTRRRIGALLPFELAAHAASVERLLDQSLKPLDLAVLVGAEGVLARGGAVERLRNLRPAMPLVLVSMSESRGVVRKAVRAGICGVVGHAHLEERLPAAIEAVLAGQIVVPETIRTRIVWSSFSLREKQVLGLVAVGLTNSEIAARLFLSESTVKSHLSGSFRKLGVSSRAEAAALVADPDNGFGRPTAPPDLVELEQQLLGFR